MNNPGWSRCGTIGLVALACASAVYAQAVSNPNQIEGTIEFTNVNPDILDILLPSGADEGFRFARVQADSPDFTGTTEFVPGMRVTTTYEVTVESGEVGSGIPYDVSVLMQLDHGSSLFQGDRYVFAPATSDPVEEEPAPNVVLNFSECAALLHITWVTAGGSPVAVTGGRMTVLFAGTSTVQALDLAIPAGSTEEYLAVRGDGSSYDVDIFFDIGTDPFSNKIRLLHETTVQADCDEIIEIEIVVPDTGGGGGGEGLGRIVGTVDMLGEDEHPISSWTLMKAGLGPFDNERFDTVPGDPSQGPFELENLVPSDATSPPRGYQVSGEMSFREGRRYEYFRTPLRGIGSNPRVLVPDGGTVDLGDTFVMDPGFLRGEIFLIGPAPGPFNSCLADIARDADSDSNGDGVPNFFSLFSGSRVEANGSNTPAPGATISAFGGTARVGFEGEFNPDPLVKAFEGDYELVLAGLLRESSIWHANRFVLRFLDTATPETPETYQDSSIDIVDRTFQEIEIVPGQMTDVPIRRCFGQLNLGFVSTATTFFDPRFSGFGRFTGLDFESNPADYVVSISTNSPVRGTPTSTATASSQGLAIACLPEGTYDLTPFVTSINPGGGTSNTELPRLLDVEVECGQIKNVTLGLQVNLDPLPACTAEPTVTLTGSVEGTGDSPALVQEIFATVNDGAPVTDCTNCGEDPPVSVEVTLEECDNAVTVTAEDNLGNVASTTGSIRFDALGPVLAGCDDVAVDGDPGGAGTMVEFEVTAADNCDGERPVVCDPLSGSLFPPGVTEVNCTSLDACGNASNCTFSVSVSVCQAAEPEVRTQGFWKRQCQGPHPSGEHDNLPDYVDPVRLRETFADVADVAGLCERLDPDPNNDKCEQAEAQFMAASLNFASDRVAECNCLDDPDLGPTTVGEALERVDGLLSNPGRTFDDCVLAQAVADRINNGDSLVDCTSTDAFFSDGFESGNTQAWTVSGL